MFRVLAVAVVLGAFLGAARPTWSETVERTIEVGGTTRGYLIHVPTGWDRARPLPVLFVFHGAGSDAENMVRATGFDALADAAPMLVVYPRAPARVKRYEVDPPPGRASADVLFVDALLERLRGRFPVDERRIWATGFSNGAALCYRLAAERPHVVAAIAPVAGYLPNLVRTAPVVPVPLLHVHGTADGRVGAPAGPTSAAETWARWNDATKASAEQRVPDAHGLVLRRRAWSGPTSRSDAALLLVEGQGHVWAGGPGGGVTRAILTFLTAHPQDEAPKATLRSNPLVGQPFGSTSSLRWRAPDASPFAFVPQRLTLLHWWTNDDARASPGASALSALEQHSRPRGVALLVVHDPKGAGLTDAHMRAHGLGLAGMVVIDDRGTKLHELSERAGVRDATGLTVLVDGAGIVRWVRPGLASGSADLAALDAVVDGLLPRATAR